jgi:hypothetical protein
MKPNTVENNQHKLFAAFDVTVTKHTHFGFITTIISVASKTL